MASPKVTPKPEMTESPNLLRHHAGIEQNKAKSISLENPSLILNFPEKLNKTGLSTKVNSRRAFQSLDGENSMSTVE